MQARPLTSLFRTRFVRQPDQGAIRNPDVPRSEQHDHVDGGTNDRDNILLYCIAGTSTRTVVVPWAKTCPECATRTTSGMQGVMDEIRMVRAHRRWSGMVLFKGR